MAAESKKRSFDAAFKLRVVEYAEGSTSRGAAKKFGVEPTVYNVYIVYNPCTKNYIDASSV